VQRRSTRRQANFQPTHQIEVVHEDRSLVEHSVSLGVFENQDAVVGVLIGSANGIGISLGHQSLPRSSKQKAIGWRMSGSPAKKINAEAGRHRHGLGSLVGRQPRILHVVELSRGLWRLAFGHIRLCGVKTKIVEI